MLMVKAFFFGVTVALAIGPIALLILARGISRGLRSAVLTGVGAALGDFFYGFLAFTAGGSLARIVTTFGPYFRPLAAIILLILAVRSIAESLRPRSRGAATTYSGDAGGHELTSTFLLTIANPLTIVVFAGFLAHVEAVESVSQSLALALGVFLGSLSIQLSLAVGGAGLNRILMRSERVIRVLNLASGAGLAGFAITGLFR
jgi:threonine/homoserine/homoserine lactone efflux protein